MRGNSTVRLYTTAATILAFFVLWTVIAARPWVSPGHAAQDPRLLALADRQKLLRHRTVATKRVIAHRWAVYKAALRAREREIAAANQAHAQAVYAAQVIAYRARTLAVSSTSGSSAARPGSAVSTAKPFASTSAPAAAPAAGQAAAAAPAPPVAAAPAPPPVQIVTLPPVSTTQPSPPKR